VSSPVIFLSLVLDTPG